MRSKMVRRYYCSYCGKGACRPSSTEKHERGCTAKPDRECGLCALFEEKQPTRSELDAALAKDIALHETGTLKIENLRDVSSNCPLCIFSTLKLNDAPKDRDFNYQEEIDAFWEDYNKTQGG